MKMLYTKCIIPIHQVLQVFFISMTEQKMKNKNDFMNLEGVKLMHNISLKY